MRALALLVLLLVPSVSACSGTDAPSPADRAADVAHQEDAATADWRAAVSDELGTDTFDFDALQAAAAVDCQRTDAAAWTVQLALSGDTATSAVTRIGLEHACPDVVDAFDRAVTTVESASDPLDLVCGPGVELTAEVEMQAELACAQR